MSNKVHFTKMHGAGNDYIYVDTSLYSIPNPAQASIKWSMPHFGIGSDGLVLIGQPKDKTTADFSMRIFNADGSEAMMCGNASRCIGKYLYDKGLTDKKSIRLETKSGIKTLHLKIDDKNKVESVTVDMLEPRFDVTEQFNDELNFQNPLLSNSAITPFLPGTFVCMGNPHYVIFVDDLNDIDIARYGKILEHEANFPQRCNIEFAQLFNKNEIKTRVWERGSGITMACGTGACATAVAAALTSRTSRECDIMMDGGTLHIKWDETDNHIYMTGPAAFAFEGDIDL
ncbi:diaminopimelate epimerase [Segatella albensis]|uniref:diaminopimelate epimerase n=1 Tax=Segatella albensis TaxID=77768 RepID=UPI0003F5741B|nr:diaminopimelate epimerase [Segatella albensis]